MIRTEFLPDPLPPEPLALAADWLAEATRLAAQPNPNAMVLATVGAQDEPSARVVLCKEIVVAPGYVCFYTNYHSRKGRALAANPRAALVMHWDHLHRQVRIEGMVVAAPAAESDTYFASRPWQRRIGAWASEQSEPVASRAVLLDALAATATRFHAPVPGPEDDPEPVPPLVIPRPPHWGGYHLWASAVELWVEGESRIHDRARWERRLVPAAGAFAAGPWHATRLQP
ncbi:MAG: Pyridoxine/pyridoxamine 5'-phosphate oxidase [Steroidobacteraceae bacterium]|nr:Pyridoxine/pyridoxamine 5'-phosphate oxidase [Steroidobacteraceae bacterium]